MKKTILLLCCSSFAVLLSSCAFFSSREITVSPLSASGQREYFRNEVVNPDGFSLEAYNFLRGNLLMDDLQKTPDQILRKLDDFYELTRDYKYLVIAADICRYLAARAEPDEAIQFHLSSFYYCWRVKMEQESTGDSALRSNIYTLTQLALNYNEVCCGIFTYLKKCKLLNSDSVLLRGRNNLNFFLEKPVYRLSVPKESVKDLSLCAAYDVSNLMQLSRRPGAGVPLVCRVNPWKSSPYLRVPPGMTIPVTVTLRLHKRSADSFGIQLFFQDTYLAESFTDQKNHTWNLALDFSTPLACFLNDLVPRNLISVMLNPDEMEKNSGLYMVEPYQVGKIPVVFIHGLMSSPSTWVQMINALKNDPVLRKKYQFWFYNYSSGSPIILSATKLRKSLMALQKELCTTPEATENFNRMVLVGHSMGGMITRLLLQDDPQYIMEKLLQSSRTEIEKKLTPEERKQVDEYLYLPGLSFVNRAVFMAVPHRGAHMAQSHLAHLGAVLIKLPTALLLKKSNIARIWAKLHPDRKLFFGYNDFYTGIDNLAPDSFFVHALQDSPLKKELVYHCIIGNKGKADIPGGSDGVVPYYSSHLDNAASEIIVDSDHSVHRRPAAIRELLRILRLHIQEIDKQTASEK